VREVLHSNYDDLMQSTRRVPAQDLRELAFCRMYRWLACRQQCGEQCGAFRIVSQSHVRRGVRAIAHSSQAVEGGMPRAAVISVEPRLLHTLRSREPFAPLTILRDRKGRAELCVHGSAI